MDWIAWNRTVLQTLRNTADYIAIHTYINNNPPPGDLERYLGQWQLTVDRYIETTAGLIKQVQTGGNARPIYVAYDEWNVWYRTGERERLEEVYNFEDALAMGMFFNSFFRHADVVKMANLAQMVNVIAPIMTNEKGLFLQPTYFPLAEYAKQRGNTALNAFVASPTYRVQGGRGQATGPEIKYLDVSATYNRDARQIFLNVLNRSRDKSIETTIDNQEGTLGEQVSVWEMNHPDLKATHTFGDDRKVRPVTRTATVPRGQRFTYTFPAHSLTILQLSLR